MKFPESNRLKTAFRLAIIISLWIVFVSCKQDSTAPLLTPEVLPPEVQSLIGTYSGVIKLRNSRNQNGRLKLSISAVSLESARYSLTGTVEVTGLGCFSEGVFSPTSGRGVSSYDLPSRTGYIEASGNNADSTATLGFKTRSNGIDIVAYSADDGSGSQLSNGTKHCLLDSFHLDKN